MTDTTPPAPDLDAIVARLMPRIADVIRAGLAAALEGRHSGPPIDDRSTRVASIADCPDCDDNGHVDLGDAVARCRHPMLSPAGEHRAEPDSLRSFAEPLHARLDEERSR